MRAPRLRAFFCAVLLSTARVAWAQDHPGQYAQAEIEAGSRLYAAQCTLCHGPNGDLIAGVDLRRGQFRRSSSDDDLALVMMTGIAGTGMPGFKLEYGQIGSLIAFIRAGFDVSGKGVTVGDGARGRAIFSGKGNCGSCHRVNGIGPRVAPDLSDIGAIRTPVALQRSLLDPTAAMLPINRPVRIVMRNGTTIRGRRLNEDTYTVQLIDEQERLVSVEKKDTREIELGQTSPMPSVAGTLNTAEIADLVAYLVSLKGL